MELTKVRISAGAVTILLLISLPFLLGKESQDSEEAGPRIKEVSAEVGMFQVIVSANGIVRPIDRIEIKSKASGEIVDLPVEEGDRVSKGELIARLDQKDERAALAQAEADLDIAQAEMTQAKRAFDRREKLYQSQLISEEERDQIELTLAVARGKVVQATTVLERTEERLAEAIVRAPIDGVILQKYVEEGQIIASGVTNVSGGTPIVDIADMKSVYIEAGVDEIDIGKINVGQEATVVADAYPGQSFYGSIVRIAPEAKVEQNVTLFDVVIQVRNPDGQLKSGMNTTIEITIVRQDDVLLIPAMALQESGERGGKKKKRKEAGEATVLLKENDTFVSHPIRIGLSNYVSVIVTSGLEEGSIVGIPMTSRLKEQNDQLEDRIRSSRSFGTSSKSSSSSR